MRVARLLPVWITRCAAVLAAVLSAVCGVVVLGGAASCGSGAFQAASKVTSVRILATSVDKPFAKPGDTVTLTTLAVDGRNDQTRPMKIYWIPIPCINPKNDAYYQCFAALSGRAQDGGAGSGGPGAGALQPGVDLTPVLPQGDTFTLTLPKDIVASHRPVPGAPNPFGSAFAFNIACAGHVEILPFDPNNINPQAPPIGCFDEKHELLGSDDYVLGFTSVFAYDVVTNANPVIDAATLKGSPVDPAVGLTMDHCTANRRSDCPEQDIDVVVPDSSWEVNPGDVDMNGTTRHEILWVDYYALDGDFDSDAKLLYDAVDGKLKDPHVKYYAPKAPGELTMWIVVHDNRGGASWIALPVHVR